MKRDKNGFIINATEDELFDVYLKNNWDDVMDFNEFMRRVENNGTEIIRKEEC